MRKFFRTVLACTLGLFACSEQAESTEERCARVRDRLIALELRLDDPARDEHARVMRRAMGDPFIQRCTKRVTERQRDCVFAASDSKSAFACIAGDTTRGPQVSDGRAR